MYGLILEAWEYFAFAILDVMSLDFAYLESHIPVMSSIRQVLLAGGWALLIGNLVFQAIKSMTVGLGFEGEDPKLLFTRTFVFSFLLVASPQICDLCLNINPDFSDSEAFASIAAEIALTRFHDKGFNRNYSWERYELDAQSVAYVLCRRFGIEPKAPNMERLSERFEGMTTDECRGILDSIQDMSKTIGRSIERGLEEKQRSRSAVRRPAR